MVLPVGRAARPVGVERRRRLVELGATVRPLGHRERIPTRRRDLDGPRATPRGPRRPPVVRVRRARRVLVVGHARRARCAHRGRRQRRDPQREHLLLAGPVRGRPPRDDVVQVPGRRGPRRRNPAGAPAERGVVGSPDRASGDLDDRPHVLARRVLTLRPRRAARLRRVQRAPARPLALRGDRPALRRRARPRRHDRRLRGRRLRAEDGAGRPAGTDACRRRARDARGAGERAGQAVAPGRAALALRP